MRFRNTDATPVEMLPGLVRRTLVDGGSMMVCEFSLAAGVEIPNHSHPHEQVGYLVSGRMQMTVGDATYELAPGDSYRAPAAVPHGAVVLEPSVMVDIFAPPREDYR